MKKVIFLVTMLLGVALISLSCNSDDSNETTNPNIPGQPQFNVSLTGELKTDYCDISTNSYAVQIEYLSGSEVSHTDGWNGTVQENVVGDATLTGDIIGARVRLTNFNPSNANSGRGTGFDDIHLKIVNVDTNEVLLDQDRNEYLVICTDVIYEILYLYNTSNGELTTTAQYHNF